MAQKRLADYVIEFVAAQGVRAVSLVPGGGSMYLVDALGLRSDIEFVPTHHASKQPPLPLKRTQGLRAVSAARLFQPDQPVQMP